MSEYTLSNTATQIDSAITRVHNADTEPLSGSGNMVTSGGVKAAIDELTGASSSTGGSLTTASFTNETLDTAITSDATDVLIPTSKAVVDYVAAIPLTPNNRNIIKIFPSDFGANFIPGRITSGLDDRNATYEIPQGFKATHVVMYIYSYTSGSRFQIKVYHDNINSASSSLVGQTAYTYKDPAGSVTINITDVSATTFNCLRVNFDSWLHNQYFYGGYIQLSQL